MLFQGKKNIVKTAEEEKAENASAESRTFYSQLSQIYEQQWEKENLKQKDINKLQMKQAQGNSKQTFKKSHKKQFETKKYNDIKPVKFKKKNEKETETVRSKIS